MPVTDDRSAIPHRPDIDWTRPMPGDARDSGDAGDSADAPTPREVLR